MNGGPAGMFGIHRCVILSNPGITGLGGRRLFRRFTTYPTWPRAQVLGSDGGMVVYGCCVLALKDFDSFLLPNIDNIRLMWKQPVLNHAGNHVESLI